MLNFILFAAPKLFKQAIPTISSWAKVVLPFVLIIGLFFGISAVMNRIKGDVSTEATKAAQNVALIAEQKKEIETQKAVIDEMRKNIEQMKTSHEATLALVKAMNEDQKKIEIKVIKKKQSIEKSLLQIERLDIPEIDKEKQKSKVLIQGLNDTYCELFINSCNIEGKDK